MEDSGGKVEHRRLISDRDALAEAHPNPSFSRTRRSASVRASVAVWTNSWLVKTCSGAKKFRTMDEGE